MDLHAKVDDDDVMLGKLALCEDAVKKLFAGGKFKREVAFRARLEALVKPERMS